MQCNLKYLKSLCQDCRIVELECRTCRIVAVGSGSSAGCRIRPVNLSLLPFCRIAVLHVELHMQECRLEQPCLHVEICRFLEDMKQNCHYSDTMLKFEPDRIVILSTAMKRNKM